MGEGGGQFDHAHHNDTPHTPTHPTPPHPPQLPEGSPPSALPHGVPNHCFGSCKAFLEVRMYESITFEDCLYYIRGPSNTQRTAHNCHTFQEGLFGIVSFQGVGGGRQPSLKMDVTVRHADTGHRCVVSVPEGGTVVELKADALEMVFAGSVDAFREAKNVVARIEGCEEELDDAHRVANTGLEDGGAVKLVPRWPTVKAPAVYDAGHGRNMMLYCITLSRCGTLCAVGYSKGHSTVFDTITADVVADLTHGSDAIAHTAFSVCGTWLAISSEDGTICVWLTSTWEQVCILDHSNTRVRTAAWTHCKRLVSGDTEGTVCVWEWNGTPSTTVLEGHSDAVQSIAVSGTWIFSGSHDKTIRVWDISTLTHEHTLEKHTGAVRGIALTNEERRLVSCADDRSYKVWCTTSLRCLRNVQACLYPDSLAVSQPGDIVAVLTATTGTTKLFRLSTGECLGKVESEHYGVALSPCGRWLFKPNRTPVTVCAVSSVSP